MSYNGSGTFNINTTGQPVVAGTVITATAFNLLTADLATGLTTAITKDGQTTTTARIPFAQGISSTLVTDSTNTTTGSIITDGGVGIAKNLNVGGTLNVTGATTLTNPVINNIKMGYSTTATAGGSTSLTVSSNYRQFFTGTLAQTIVLPVTSTLVTGMAYEIENNSTGTLTVNSSGGNLVGTIPAGVCAHAVCIGTTLTTAADWDWDYISTTTITGTGANVLGTSPTITTATLASPNITTALTLTGAAGTSGQALTSQGSGVAPIWSTIGASAATSTALGTVYGKTDTSQQACLGYQAANSSSGNAIVAVGYRALYVAGVANNTTALGFQAGVAVTSGGENVIIGENASSTLTTGANNIFIGSNCQNSSASVTYEIAIGKSTTGKGQNTGYINANNGGVYQGNNSSSWSTTSDRRLKKNITDNTEGLDKISQIRVRNFEYRLPEEVTELPTHTVVNKEGVQLGVIAQELQEICPDCVKTESTGVVSVDSDNIFWHMVNAIKDLKALNDSLTARITALENA